MKIILNQKCQILKKNMNLESFPKIVVQISIVEPEKWLKNQYYLLQDARKLYPSILHAFSLAAFRFSQGRIAVKVAIGVSKNQQQCSAHLSNYFNIHICLTVSQNLKSRINESQRSNQIQFCALIYSMINDFKEKIEKSIDWFWKKLGSQKLASTKTNK